MRLRWRCLVLVIVFSSFTQICIGDIFGEKKPPHPHIVFVTLRDMVSIPYFLVLFHKEYVSCSAFHKLDKINV